MFSENEIAVMIEVPEILEPVVALRKEFIQKEASFLEISEHDFLSLIMMTPSVGIALANGTVSLFEELALNKMARKMSKGGFFLKLDPVVHVMKYLIRNFEEWEDKFYAVIRTCMSCMFSTGGLKKVESDFPETDINYFTRELMQVPYAFVRFIASFFIHDAADIVAKRSISKVEYEKVLDIGKRLQISDYVVFTSFCNTYDVK